MIDGGNIITASRLRTWRECKRLHHYTYVEGWRARRMSEALRVGIIAHVGMETFWLAVQAGCNVTLTTKRVDQMIRYAADKAMGDERSDEEKQEDLYAAALVTVMLHRYIASWWPHLQRFEILHVEPKFTHAIINPDTMRESRTYKAGGKCDLIVRDKTSGKILVVEHKTTSEDVSDDAQDYWAKLVMDVQVSQYILGAQSIIPEHVDGVLYDVLRKPLQRPGNVPVLDADGNKQVFDRAGQRVYTAAGKPRQTASKKDGYTLKTRAESPQEYADRCAEVMDERGADHYFRRRIVPRLESDVREFMADVWVEAKAIHASIQTGHAPRNPDACHRYGRCAFWEVCANGLKMEHHPERYTRIDYAHPELR